MQYVGQSRYFVCALTALLYLLVLSCTASALSLAYDRNYGAAYANILQGAADVPLEPHGYAQSLLDLFQDRRWMRSRSMSFKRCIFSAVPRRRCTGIRILRRPSCSPWGRMPLSP